MRPAHLKRLLVLSFVILAGPASAQSGSDAVSTARIRLGPLGLTPAIAIQNVGIDSNVFNETENPKQDVTATVHPQLAAWLRLGRAQLSLDGSVEAVHFTRYSSQSSINANGSATLDARWNRLSAFVGTGLGATRQRQGFEIDTRARRVVNILRMGSSVRLSGKTSVGVRAERQKTAFDLDAKESGASLGEALNRHADTVTASLDYRLTPMTTIVLKTDLQRDTFDFSSARDSRRLLVTPGVQFKPNALISGSAFVGYRRFDTLQATAPPFHGAYASIDLSYTLMGRTQFGVQSLRDVEYSFEPLQSYYLITGVAGSVSQALSRSWVLSARAGRQRLNYRRTEGSAVEDPSTTDTVTEYGGGIAYRLSRTIQLGINADYNRRLSREHLRDYKGLRVNSFVTYGGGR